MIDASPDAVEALKQFASEPENAGKAVRVFVAGFG